MQSPRPKKCRVKLFIASADSILFWLSRFGKETQPDLPEGARVLALHPDLYRQAFVFHVEHESFEEVVEANCPPEIPLLVKWLNFPPADSETPEQRSAKAIAAMEDTLKHAPMNCEARKLILKAIEAQKARHATHH